MMLRRILPLTVLFAIGVLTGFSQSDTTKQKADTLSKFDQFNKKAEHFFKIFPVPIISYSTDAGNIFGLAKFNTFHPSKKDTMETFTLPFVE